MDEVDVRDMTPEEIAKVFGVDLGTAAFMKDLESGDEVDREADPEDDDTVTLVVN